MSGSRWDTPIRWESMTALGAQCLRNEMARDTRVYAARQNHCKRMNAVRKGYCYWCNRRAHPPHSRCAGSMRAA